MKQYRPSLLPACHKWRVLGNYRTACLVTPVFQGLAYQTNGSRTHVGVRIPDLCDMRIYLFLHSFLYLRLIFSEISCRKSRAPYPGRWNTWRESARSALAPPPLCTRRRSGSRRWRSLGRGCRSLHRSWGTGRGLWEKKYLEKFEKYWHMVFYPTLSRTQLEDFSENTLLQGLRIWIRSAWAGKSWWHQNGSVVS